MSDWIALYNTNAEVENWTVVPVLAGLDEKSVLDRLSKFGYETPDFIVHFVEWEFGWNREDVLIGAREA